MNYNPYYNYDASQQEQQKQQQTQQVQQPQGQQQYPQNGYYQQPQGMVQGIPQSQSIFAGGVPGQQVQQQPQTQGQIQNAQQPNPYISPYENYGNANASAGLVNTTLTDARVQAGFGINELSDKTSIQRYIATSNNAIRTAKREALDYKALWMEANTANVKLRQDNEYLHEQVQLNNTIKTQQLEMDNRRARQDAVVNQSRNQLKDMLEEDWQNHIKSGKL